MNTSGQRSEQRLLRVQDAAHELSVSVRSMWRLLSRGDLQQVKIGRAVRVTRESIDAFIEKGGVR
ncbi:MAG: helix-turn-helix domain-containing protein [Phycisphaerales bacterium]